MTDPLPIPDDRPDPNWWRRAVYLLGGTAAAAQALRVDPRTMRRWQQGVVASTWGQAELARRIIDEGSSWT